MFDSWWLAQPSSLMVVMLVATVLALALRRTGLAIGTAVFALLLVAVPMLFDISGVLAWELERRAPVAQQLPERVDGILVLGGAVEWSVSRERGQLNLNRAAERVVAAAALARRYPQARLAFTGVYREDVQGDFVVNPTDASMFFGEEYRGRSLEFIGEARSTYEDALLALERLQPRAGERWLLVTSALHMPRAVAVFRTLGWGLTPYPVDYRTLGPPELINPNLQPAAAMAELDEVVREWGAVLVYIATDRISWP